MFTVTDAATAQLDAMLAEAPDEAAIRFVPNGESLEPRLDQPREDDTTYTHGEKVVLVVGPQLGEALSDHVLDARATEQGPQLTLAKQGNDNGAPAD